MTPVSSEDVDERVIRVAAASRAWRTLLAAEMAVRMAWSRSISRRVMTAVSDGHRWHLPWVILWAGVAALVIPFAGTRREGPFWVVPVVAIVLAAVVIWLAPTDDPRTK